MSFFAPRAVWMAEPNWEREALAGSDAIRAFLEDWFTTLSGLEVGEGAVMTISTFLGHLPASSEPHRQHHGHVFEFRDGVIVRWTAYTDIDEARAAAERLAKERG